MRISPPFDILRACALAFCMTLAPAPALAQSPDQPDKPAKKQPDATPPPAQPPAPPPAAPAPAAEIRPEPVSPYVLGETVKDIDGNDQDLAQYKGKVVLIVNTASKCGFTPQYHGLEQLYQKYKDRGLVVLGFPANDFREQEPGTNAEIKQFCATYKGGVTFPMFAKVSVVSGAAQSPLYRRLASQPAPIGGDPKWNFTKFLVDRSGNVVARYEHRVKPDDDGLRRRIEELLGPVEKPEAPKPAGN